MDEVQVESHWEQGSANGADVRQAWGGTAGWGGAKQHRREALGTLREREVERGEKLQRQYKTGNQHAKKLEPWPPVWQTNKVTLLLSARAQIVDRAFFLYLVQWWTFWKHHVCICQWTITIPVGMMICWFHHRRDLMLSAIKWKELSAYISISFGNRQEWVGTFPHIRYWHTKILCTPTRNDWFKLCQTFGRERTYRSQHGWYSPCLKTVRRQAEWMGVPTPG